VRRSKTGQFKKEVNVGRSLAADRRRKAKTQTAKGQGDRGDIKHYRSVVEGIVRKPIGVRRPNTRLSTLRVAIMPK
jgi:hypothetical protein